MKRVIPLFLKLLLFLSIIFFVYYLFFLKPKLLIPKTLLNSEKILSLNYLYLVQNRVSLAELNRLDSNSSSFGSEYSDLVASIKSSKEKGTEILTQNSLKDIGASAPDPTIDFINNQLNPESFKLFGKTDDAYKRQEGFIDALDNLYNDFADLFSSRLYLSYSQTELETDKENILETVSIADKGLGKMLDNVRGRSSNQTTKDELESQVAIYRADLAEFSKLLSQDDYESAYTVQTEINKNLENLNKAAFQVLSDFLKSDASANLLKDQTNLILEYEFWLEKIDSYQESFY